MRFVPWACQKSSRKIFWACRDDKIFIRCMNLLQWFHAIHQSIKFFTILLAVSLLYNINIQLYIYIYIYFDQHIDIFCLNVIHTLPGNCTNISIFRIVHLKFLRLEIQVLYTLKHDILWSEDPPRCCFLARSW